MAVINTLVEGLLDAAIAARLIGVAGHDCGTSYGKKGSGYIKNKIRSFNSSAQAGYYLALVDFMDTHENCPANVVSKWLPNKHPKMLFRVVVREIESWLLADRNGLASYLGINAKNIPGNPERILDPKIMIVNLARNSRNRFVRTNLVPNEGSTAQVGKLYLSEMQRFVNDKWDISAARNNARSLDKCLKVLEEVV
ncbi:MAG: hypothetical protein AB1469_08895 [Pseudomonadota bacterium]